MRNMKAILLFVLITALLSSLVIAGPNPNHGKSLYKSNCKACHIKNGEAKDLTPISKTQDQWKRGFEKKIDVMVKRVMQKTGAKLTPQDIADMQIFLVSHAADSDHPETCGNR